RVALRACGESKHHGCAAIDFALNRGRSAVELHNRFHQRETEAGSVGTTRRFSTVKAIENTWQMFGRDATAIVTDRHPEIAVLFRNGNTYCPVLRCESQRVLQQISHNTFEQIRVGINLP